MDTSGLPEGKPHSASRFELVGKAAICKRFGRGGEREEGSGESAVHRWMKTGRREGQRVLHLPSPSLPTSTFSHTCWVRGRRTCLQPLRTVGTVGPSDSWPRAGPSVRAEEWDSGTRREQWISRSQRFPWLEPETVLEIKAG